MRVLFVSVHPDHCASASQHRVDMLAACLKKQGCETDIIYCRNSHRIIPGQIGRNIQVGRYSMPWLEYDYFYGLGALVTLSLKKHQPPLGARVLYDCHGHRFAEIRLNRPGLSGATRAWFYRKLEKRAARYADLVITVSKPLIEDQIRFGVDPDRLCLIRNGVDIDQFKPLPSRSDGGRFVVTYAGAFQKYQAVDILAEAARLLKDEPAIQFRIIGFTYRDAELRKRLQRVMPPSTELLDRCDRQRLVELLSDSDLLTIPRRPFEACRVALPTKFAEYCAMAKPVLVNTVDETCQIVRQNKCGFVAHPDPQNMAQAIREAARCDRGLLAEMGLRGREFVIKEMSWDQIGKQFAGFLSEHMPKNEY